MCLLTNISSITVKPGEEKEDNMIAPLYLAISLTGFVLLRQGTQRQKQS